MDHASDCARHNEPAYPAGDCDCGADWVSATTPPPDERACIVRMSDGTERLGNACYGPTGELDGWMCEAGPEPDDASSVVVQWQYQASN